MILYNFIVDLSDLLHECLARPPVKMLNADNTPTVNQTEPKPTVSARRAGPTTPVISLPDVLTLTNVTRRMVHSDDAERMPFAKIPPVVSPANVHLVSLEMLLYNA